MGGRTKRVTVTSPVAPAVSHTSITATTLMSLDRSASSSEAALQAAVDATLQVAFIYRAPRRPRGTALNQPAATSLSQCCLSRPATIFNHDFVTPRVEIRNFQSLGSGGSDCREIRVIMTSSTAFNPLMATLKPQSNGPLYSNTVIGTLAVDG